MRSARRCARCRMCGSRQAMAFQTVAAKGAPEAVMDLRHLDDAKKVCIANVVDELAAEGLRVLAVARGSFVGQDWPANEHDFDFAFIGLLGLAVPVRPQVPAAVAECRAAGIRVVMITGDYPATARAIARQAGLVEHEGGVLSGDEITTLSDEAASCPRSAMANDPHSAGAETACRGAEDPAQTSPP